MATVYYPRPDSFPALVCGFFANNPDESLTIDDMVDKFALRSSANIHTQLSLALEAKLLKRVRGEDGDYIYSKGPALQITGSVEAAAPTPTAPMPAPTPAPTKRTALDLSAIVIRSGVPMPSSKNQIDRVVEYLAKLEVGQMFDLPLAGKHIMNKAIERQHKAGLGRFTSRVDKATQTIGVWCEKRAES